MSDQYVDVSWKSIPSDKWNGDPLGIYIDYRVAKKGGAAVVGNNQVTLPLKRDQHYYRITGLESNMEIAITLYGYTKVGNGTKSKISYGSK